MLACCGSKGSPRRASPTRVGTRSLPEKRRFAAFHWRTPRGILTPSVHCLSAEAFTFRLGGYAMSHPRRWWFALSFLFLLPLALYSQNPVPVDVEGQPLAA